MDLILLPDAAVDGVPAARLNSFVAWLAADAEPIDVYAMAPPDPHHDDRFFTFLATLDPGPGFLYLVVPAARIDDALLRRIEESGIAYVIADDDGVADVSAALDAIAAYFDDRPDSSLMLGVWTEAGNSGSDRARMQRWADAGISAEVVRPRPFPGPAAQGTDPAVPSQLLGGLLGCALYAYSFTVGGAGKIHACPRDTGGLPTDLGSLHDSPEELVMKRGRFSPLAGNFAICESCTARGRFSWSTNRGAAATRLWNAGRTAATSGPPVPASLAETPPASDGEIETTLREFEQRLEQWNRGEQALGRSGE